MKYDEFMPQMNRLLAGIGKPFGWDDIESPMEFYQLVKGHDMDALQRGVAALFTEISNRRDFPVPAQLRAAVDAATGGGGGPRLGEPLRVQSCDRCIGGMFYDENREPAGVCDCDMGKWLMKKKEQIDKLRKKRGFRVQPKTEDGGRGGEPKTIDTEQRRILDRMQGERPQADGDGNRYDF